MRLSISCALFLALSITAFAQGPTTASVDKKAKN